MCETMTRPIQRDFDVPIVDDDAVGTTSIATCMLEAAAATAAAAAAPRELLIMACSPAEAELAEVGAEALQVATACSWGGEPEVRIRFGGTAEDLRRELNARGTKRFLFSGHADKKVAGSQAAEPGADSQLKLSLGFTAPGSKKAIPLDDVGVNQRVLHAHCACACACACAL